MRGGPLGDCVLTLPLVTGLAKRGPVAVLTREAYFPILEALPFAVDLHSLDSAGASTLFSPKPGAGWEAVFENARVYDFLPRGNGKFADNLQELGAHGHVALESRPARPPHIVEQVQAMGGLPCPAGLLRTSLLGHLRKGRGTHAWIHPGSGSPAKNTSMEQLRELYEARTDKPPILASFGEADLELEPAFRKAFAGTDYETLKPASIAELMAGLATRAAFFLGNDSGPGHLAAALGVPTQIVFQSTDPDIWRPVGAEVTVCG